MIRNIKDLINDWKNEKIELGLYTTKDENNTNVIIEITNDYIKISTPQNNGWTRVNYYYKDNTAEETYER